MKFKVAVVASIFSLSSFEAFVPHTARAQDCDSVVSDILIDIRDRGATIDETRKSDASRHPGNPFPGSESFVIFLSGSGDGSSNPKRSGQVANNIMMSMKLQEAWTNRIMGACSSYSIVVFALSRSGWRNAFYRFKDGRVRPKVCVSDMTAQSRWGVGWCD